ncbi:MAG: RNA-binding protein [Candidatus Cloacimonadota bacterium]|nr:MAG: RNA-binding protein [Candidatus Cloacimonadota bacterium]PIE78247.1 MAG: RNA-binding protein [Candidatus Delongbacteria bacterium]
MDIYVGNIPYSLTEEELREIFEAHGEVASARIIKDRETGRSKGFGFVNMPENDEAEVAIKEMNGNEFKGRPLRVNEARGRD